MSRNKLEEKEFHDTYVTSTETRSLESNFYCAAARELEYEISFDFVGDLHGKKLLFYGSGAHLSLIRKFVQRGADVVAIDISPETIEKLNRTMAEEEELRNRCEAMVMDCESLTFPAASFDIVFARSIIHHLDVCRSLEEISRVLKPCGKFTVLEPLGTNPLINLYRLFTPNARTSGERPLVPSDIEAVGRLFPVTKAHYLYCLSILAYFYRMIDRNEARFNKLFATLCKLDRTFLKTIPGYRYLCWDVLLCCER